MQAFWAIDGPESKAQREQGVGPQSNGSVDHLQRSPDLKRLIFLVTALAFCGTTGCSNSDPNAGLKPVDRNVALPKLERAQKTKDRARAESLPPPIQ